MEKGKIKSFNKKKKVKASGNACMQAHREERLDGKLTKTENRESQRHRRTVQDAGDLREDNYRRRKSQ